MNDEAKNCRNLITGGYSQYDEDVQLKHILPKTGYFLEIGAYCPYIFSNTRFLVEMGWHGCYIDGCSYSISRFIDEYKENDNITIVQALVGDTDKLVEFYNSIKGDLTSSFVTNDAVSTTDKNHMNKWKNGGYPFRKVYTQMISTKTLETILPNTVDFINIDVEGQSAHLATLINYDNLNTKVVCIEHDNEIEKLVEHFKKYNFELVWINHTNVIFSRQ